MTHKLDRNLTTPAPASCMHELFEAHVARRPLATAVVDEHETLTYAELNRRANRLARYLRQRGAQPGECIPIVMPRCLHMLVAQLAVLKSGCAYVPIDPEWPRNRQSWVLRDCGARRVLLAEARIGAELLNDSQEPGSKDPSQSPVQWLDVVQAAPEILGCSDANPPACGSGESVAYVMYTSGSTGVPKGVMVPHRAVKNLVIANGYAQIDDTDGVAHCSNPAFDASTFEVWGALLNGARLCIVPRAVLFEPERLCAQLLQQRVTVLLLTVGLFNPYSEVLAEAFKGLKYLLVGGDVLNPRTIATVLSNSRPRHVLNAYGPTECTTIAATHRIEAVAAGDLSIPIGRPIANTRIHILDEHGAPVPAGVSGEIYVGGACVALGYLNRPQLTAERFLKDPFGVDDSARMYRTGDLGRWRDDGAIEFLGRNDFQVKLRGFRIELGEIEARLSQYPGVRDALVVAREDKPGDKRLVAYYTRRGGDEGGPDSEPVSARALQSHLSRSLPEYMVPAAYVPLDRFPLTANGKLDRSALPAPDARNLPEIDIDYAAPVGAWEQEVAAVWADILKIERVGRNDGFATLAGTSIQAIEVSFHFGRRYARGAQLPAPIGNVTLAEYAEMVRDELTRLDGHDRQEDATPAAHDSPPASYAQQQVWFLEQLGDASRAYRFDARFDFKGTLDADALKRALEELVRRHEIFRTAFVAVEGQLQLKVEPHVALPLRCIDLSPLAETERAAALKAAIAAEVSSGFALERAPLIRWLLVRLSDQEHVFIQSEHHFLHDGQSFRIVVRDLAALYNAAKRGTAAVLPQIEGQYSDFCVQERQEFASPRFQRGLEEWTRKLQGLDFKERLFSDRQTGRERRFLGAQLRRSLPAHLIGGIGELAARRGLSRFCLMMSAFALLCARYSGSEEFIIGTALANRRSSKFQWTTGMFVNMLPIPFDCNPDRAFDQFARAVSRDIDFALARTDIPLSEIVTKMGAAAALKGEAPFSVGFSFHDSLALTAGFDGLQVEIEELICNGSSKFDLDVVAILGAHGESIELMFEYDTDRFEPEIVDRMMTHYFMLLDELVIDPDRRLAEFPRLTESDRQQLLGVWVNTPAAGETSAHRPGATVPELFEQRVARCPDAVALWSEDQELSYRELNSRANRLAHYLRARGIGPEIPVVVSMERSAELIVSLLGILKAGGVYVPVSSDSTPERLERAMAAVGAPILLTKQHLGDASREIAQHPDTDPAAHTQPANLAYCIFTSGSTGDPKGVAVSLQALVNHALSHADACGIGPADRVLQICAPSFDASLEEIVPTLIAGAALVIAPRQFRAPDEEFLQWLQARAITIMDVPTAFWGVLVSYLAVEGKASLPSSLRALIIGGEAARWEHVDAMQTGARPGQLRLFNTYGPTETTIVATRGAVDPAAQTRRGASVPLGRAIANVRIYVLDAQLNPVPIGAKGQIYIAGAGVARGYWRRPDLTAERFLPDPFGRPGERMYATGDFGRYLPDGQLEFLGRVDSQVKISGFRVEPTEIEAMLLRQSGVREAAVAAWSPDGSDTRLAAYLVGDERSPTTIDELRAELRRFLPDYMVPTTWTFLDRLPLNSNGKLDRKRLPAPVVAHSEPQPRAAEGSGEFELHAILAILRELLPGVVIEPSDDLFAKGMHSLLVLRFVTRCRDRLGIKLRVRDLYTLASPAALADHIHKARMPAA